MGKDCIKNRTEKTGWAVPAPTAFRVVTWSFWLGKLINDGKSVRHWPYRWPQTQTHTHEHTHSYHWETPTPNVNTFQGHFSSSKDKQTQALGVKAASVFVGGGGILFGQKRIIDPPDQQVAIVSASQRRITSHLNEEKEIKRFLPLIRCWKKMKVSQQKAQLLVKLLLLQGIHYLIYWPVLPIN